MKQVTATAHPNIAIIKYWGKRDDRLILPHTNSLSITLDTFESQTTVKPIDSLDADIVIFNGERLGSNHKIYKRAVEFLTFVRETYNTQPYCKIETINNFDHGVGLASSASGAAALAAATAAALEINMNRGQLSMLARRASGSGTRSIHGGFVEWHCGIKNDGTDSSAVQLAPKTHWPSLRLIVIATAKNQKKISSRAGMKKTVATSPYYQAWVNTIEKDLEQARVAIANRDLAQLGDVAERNCLKMHALMLSTIPALIYWSANTINIIRAVYKLRQAGIPVYFTIDAGQNVILITEEQSVDETLKSVKMLVPGAQTSVCSVGGAAHI